MSEPQILDPAAIIPGGIRPDDHIHRETNDGTCSRCRWPVPEDEVPLHLWLNDGQDMLTYCKTCLAMPAEKGRSDD